MKWNKLYPGICSSGSYIIFRKLLLKFIRPGANKNYNNNKTLGIKLSTRLYLGFSHLWEQKFRHNFKATLNSLCSCGTEAESTSHFFLCCPFFNNLRENLTDNLRNIDRDLSSFSDVNLANVMIKQTKSF